MEYSTKTTPFFDPGDLKTIGLDHISTPFNAGDNIWIVDGVAPKEFCNYVVEDFESRKERHQDGATGSGVNKEVKDSKDLLITREQDSKAIEIDRKLYEFLHLGTEQVIKKLMEYPCSVGWYPNQVFHHDTGYQLQKTTPGGRYVWHVENSQGESCVQSGSALRTLTYIIYLNDVPEDHGGSTGFLYQKVKVQPKAGRLVLFPPYWTHVHSGYPLEKGVKYIATGWFFSEAHRV